LIVQPCEEFAGIGIYQLFAHGKALVRRCRQVDENLIEIKADGPTRGGVCVYLPIEQFEEQVCGLVLGQIQSHNDAWMADLCAKRTKFYS